MRFATCLSAIVLMAACSGNTPPPAASHGEMKLSGPFVHENLAVFLVEDPSVKSMGEFITLKEGLDSGVVKVSEKKEAQVSELLIENSSDKPCFVQAGDLVKGGQQDRTIGADFVIPPKTAPSPIPSFCVERGRWHGGGQFADYRGNVSGNALKLSVQLSKSQAEVWESVAKQKMDLYSNNALPQGKSTSLNEELEHGKIQERREAFRKALGKLIEGRPHAVGMVAAVNGKLSTADVYGDPGLFRKLYAGLLDTAALEAVAVKASDAKAPTTDDVSAFLRKSEEGRTKEESLRPGLRAEVVDNDKTARFRCIWNDRELHRQAVGK